MIQLSETMLISLVLAVLFGLFVADVTWNGFRGK
jgi:hypothetical protein